MWIKLLLYSLYKCKLRLFIIFIHINYELKVSLNEYAKIFAESFICDSHSNLNILLKLLSIKVY